MIESLDEFKEMCLELWERWHIDTPTSIPMTKSTVAKIAEGMLASQYKVYCGPNAWGPYDASVDTVGFKITSLMNPVTRSVVRINEVPDK